MYTEYQPSHLLAPYVDNYWELKGTPEYGMRIHILPDGCTDFIFTLGEVAEAAVSFLLCRADDKILRIGHLRRIHSYVWYPLSALRVVLLHKVAFA